MSDVAPLLTARLVLEHLLPATLVALSAQDKPSAELAQGRALPDALVDPELKFFYDIQVARMQARPDGKDWCARAMVRADDDLVIGHCGFHGPPEDLGRAEIGYTVLEPYRRQGYAVEAATRLTQFAASKGTTTVFASVAPDNEASLGVVRALGFVQTGVQHDEIDGEEWVFELAV